MDLVQLLSNLLLISFLGLLVAFNPMLIVVDIMLVLKSRRPILNTAILAAGFVSSIVLLFAIASSVIDPDSQVSLRKLKDNLELPPLVDILAGTLLLGYALKRRRNYAPRPQQAANNFKVPEKPYQLFVFGFVKAILSITNLFAVLILAKLAVTNDWNIARGLVAVLWLLLVGVIPLAAIAYFRQFRHESLVNIDKRINRIMSRDTALLITYVLGVTGALFTISGLVNLLRG
jgi:hypothetical protein